MNYPPRSLSITLTPCIMISRINVLVHHSGVRHFNHSTKRIVVHQADKPAFEKDIDFNSIGLKYPVKSEVTFVVPKIGWLPKPETLPNLPFVVERTGTAGLPIYTDYKHGRTKVVTILRKCKGDINELKSEMEKVVGRPVTMRPGKLVVDGNYHLRLKTWLAGLGF